MTADQAPRVVATDAAIAELGRLRAEHGPLMLFQSGGCCDGSSPICLADGELLLGPNDLRLGEVGGAPFYIDADQYERWNQPQFLLDVSSGAAEGFSLEGLEGIHFVVRSTVCESRLPLSTPSAADSAC
jgi:uncharacterized protein (DUF779 family)